ncbi:MAG: aminoacyl-tRNA hydrolase [Gammaproteobacteria bacterium]
MANAKTPLALIVGLGNPGPSYEHTRHNAGAWFVEQAAKNNKAVLRAQPKFHGHGEKITLGAHACHLLIPTTFMNNSGEAVRAIAQFYKIPPTAILVAHDELDLECGKIRLKQGGGHGGHNGLRNIIKHLGSPDFFRLRIGIGHPGHKDKVLNYVLGKPSMDDNIEIQRAIEKALSTMPTLLTGELQKVMKVLHTEK